jgi:hypothetical protein
MEGWSSSSSRARFAVLCRTPPRGTAQGWLARETEQGGLGVPPAPRIILGSALIVSGAMVITFRQGNKICPSWDAVAEALRYRCITQEQ